MLIIMAGLPYSGKTTFVQRFIEELRNTEYTSIVLVDPTIGFPSDFNLYPADQKSAISIAAWEVALDELAKTIQECDNDTVIILDTTGSNSSALTSIIDRAILRKHKTLLVKVIAPVDDCKERAGSDWVGDEICKKYEHRMATDVEHLKGICNRYVPVLNINKLGIDPVLKAARDLANSISKQINEPN